MKVGLTFSPDGKTLAAASVNRPACLWDLATGKEMRRFGGDECRPRWVAFSPDGKTLAYGGHDDPAVTPGIRLGDVATGKELRRLDGHAGDVNGVAF
jgi:WD40 repeat protein